LIPRIAETIPKIETFALELADAIEKTCTGESILTANAQ
jgi:hypothetical protein